MNRASARVVVFAVLLVIGAVIARDGLQLARMATRERSDLQPVPDAITLPTNADALALRSVTCAITGVRTIHGWSAPTRSGVAAILRHGSGGDRREVLGAARAILFDWPAHGGSEGVVRYAPPERRVSFVQDQPGVDGTNTPLQARWPSDARSSDCGSAECDSMSHSRPRSCFTSRHGGPANTTLADRRSGPRLL